MPSNRSCAGTGSIPRTACSRLGPRDRQLRARPRALRALLAEQGERIALVLLPGVQYLTGERLDVAALRGGGAALRLPRRLRSRARDRQRAARASTTGADFAVWCSYKYLNAGPGAVGGCFVHGGTAPAEPAAARRLVGTRSRAAVPHGAEVRAAVRRRGLAAQQPADPVARAARGVARAVRRGRPRRAAPQVGAR